MAYRAEEAVGRREAAHAFTFTPSISLFVDCDDRDQIDRLYERLADGGQALMPPASYGFSQWFAWVQDRFGVSWQLNLESEGGEGDEETRE